MGIRISKAFFLYFLMFCVTYAACSAAEMQGLSWAFERGDAPFRVKLITGLYGRTDRESIDFLRNTARESKDTVMRLAALATMCGVTSEAATLVTELYHDSNLLISAYCINQMLNRGLPGSGEAADYAFLTLKEQEYAAEMARLRQNPAYHLIANRYLIDSYLFMMELIISSCRRHGIKPPLHLVEKYGSVEDFACLYPLECCIRGLDQAVRSSSWNSLQADRTGNLINGLRMVELSGHKPAAMVLREFLGDEAVTPRSSGAYRYRVCDVVHHVIYRLLTGKLSRPFMDQDSARASVEAMRSGLQQSGLKYLPE
ncbi:MAG: hypothetical protein PHQ23_06300 [Candidatus Wallbacteria bacterium]|nr:hypothetical protein [Candidatus Wallbacteria bacterium]